MKKSAKCSSLVLAVFFGLLTGCTAPSAPEAHSMKSSITVNNPGSATQIDPSGGAAIATTNPSFSTAFTRFCSEAFAAKSQSAMSSTPGITILDFESGNGFGATTQSLSSTGTAFTDINSIAPFNISSALTGISTAGGTSIALEWRTFDDGANILSAPDAAHGVFLVRDNGTATMTSGVQGLIAGAVSKASLPGGAYLTFDRNLSDFGVVLNVKSGSATDLIALFDVDGVLIAKYKVASASGAPLFFGVNSPTGIIRSVWIGQSTAANGLVIDDLAFKAAPAPATSLSYSFSGSGAMNGWTATSGAVLTTGPTSLTITATNADSKIYRTVTLPAGTYDIAGTGGGNLLLQLQTSWTTYPIGFLNLSTQSTSEWRTDRQRFTTPGGNLFLVVRSTGSSGSSAIQSLTVSTAYVTPYAYDTAQMKSLRPSPAMVRGFMTGGNVTRDSYLSDAKSWGANVLRLQLDPGGYAKSVNQDFWTVWPTYLDSVVAAVERAQASGLKVVVDLHKWPFADTRSDAENWERPELNETMCRVWRDLATALLPYDDAVWGFDLFNEPNNVSEHPLPPRKWWPLATNIRNTIRTVNPNVWLIYEPGPGYMFSGFSWLDPLPDARVMYSAHFYDPLTFTHQGVNGSSTGIHYPATINGSYWDSKRLADVIAPATTFQAKWSVPIYVGEFSAVRWGPVPDTANYLQDVINLLEARGWSWTYHAFREWNGWDLEMDSTYWKPGMSLPVPVSYTTDRAAVVKAGLQKNNQALLAAVTASSTYTNTSWGLSKVVDGTTSSTSSSAGWTSNNSPTIDHLEWVQLDLRATYSISQVVLYPRSDGNITGYGFPVEFTIERSTDNNNWTPVVTETNYPLPGASGQFFTFAAAPTRYLRITGKSLRSNPYDGNRFRMQFAEIEAY